MKIPPVVAELFHTDRQIDRHDKVNSLFFFFGDFTNAPKNDRKCTSNHVDVSSGLVKRVILLLTRIEWGSSGYLISIAA